MGAGTIVVQYKGVVYMTGTGTLWCCGSTLVVSDQSPVVEPYHTSTWRRVCAPFGPRKSHVKGGCQEVGTIVYQGAEVDI